MNINPLKITVLFFMLLSLCGNIAFADDKPSHARPYFMPQSERTHILELIAKEAWAKTELHRVEKLAKTDGYQAAFLYA
ncbi:MAG: hypothetical protein KAJ95_04700, partial [Gammaproteobacteria bacterium]|nr:hypothetical protein [Gammaproteobacteria bacterium]